MLRYLLPRLLAVSLVAGPCIGAHAAQGDKTVTFNVPVKLEKLDPQVTATHIICAIQGINNYSNVVQSNDVSVAQTNSYAGMMSVAVTVNQADVGRAKTWQCYVKLVGPGVQSGVSPNASNYPWSKAAPGLVDTVSGTF